MRTLIIPAILLALMLGIGAAGYERTRESPWTRVDWGTRVGEAETALGWRFRRGCAWRLPPSDEAAALACTGAGSVPVLELRDRLFLGTAWDSIRMVFRDDRLSEVVLWTHEGPAALQRRLTAAYGRPTPDSVQGLPVLWFRDVAEGAWAMIYDPSPTPEQVVFVPIKQ